MQQRIRSAMGQQTLAWLGLAGLGVFAMVLALLKGAAAPQSTGADWAGHPSDDWITVNKDYSSQRYVNLDQITPANVSQLKEVCEIQLNDPVWFNGGLLKVGRTLYVTTLRATYAFDAANCQLRWKKPINFQQLPASNNQRGAGYLDGRIFRGTADGRVMALDAKTGQVVWETMMNSAADPKKHEAFNSAPVAWQGKVFIGIIVGDAGIAGRLMAFDAVTGTELWRFDTTMGKHAGGGLWTTYSLDPKTGEVFAGVANPYPDFNRNFDKDDDTALTNSVISVDAINAKLNWSYQAVPHDDHDWDLATAPTLYRTRAGKEMLAITGKGGRVYGIDRDTHTLVFNTPATTVAHDDEPLDKTWKLVCPGVQGGAMFNGTAYHPGTGMLYVGMSDHCAFYTKNKAFKPLGGTVVKDWSAAAKLKAPKGWITAMDGETGHILWQYRAESQVQAGLVPTKSGLLFAGDSNGNLFAFDAKSGAVLKRIDVKGALNNGLISYEVKGEQYVAAAVGGITENPHSVAGPLRVSIFGLHSSGPPEIVKLDRLQPVITGLPPSSAVYWQACLQCHGFDGSGVSAPSIIRQSQLADPQLLKHFLETVPPPMPRLYPGMLEEEDVEMIAEHLRTFVFKCGQPGGQSCKPPGEPKTGGTAAWRAVYSVLTSPRCLNCHPGPTAGPFTVGPVSPAWPARAFDYPRQGDDRHPHYYGIMRGAEVDETTGKLDNKGAPFARCASCHGSENNPTTGIPGAKDEKTGITAWHLTPAEMAWESSPGVPFTGAELCAQLKDPARNGGRDYKALLEHVKTDALVLWGFDPGTRLNGEPRTTPPISHEEFVDRFEDWIDAGAPCPGPSDLDERSSNEPAHSLAAQVAKRTQSSGLR
jgi:alcohol dehydrogenase (cytochrome c)